MAEINLGNDTTINTTLSNVDNIQASVSTEESISANIPDINYIPGYVVAEQERRANEIVRQSNEADRIALYEDMESKLESGYFKGDKGDPGDDATINGYKAITITTSGDITGTQSGSTYTIGADLSNYATKNDVKVEFGGETFDTNQEWANVLIGELNNAFGDVWEEISKKQNSTDNSLNTNNKTIPYAINEVNSIAKGANQALSYASYSAMVTAINALSSTALNVGQNIMIVTVEVPDLWVSSVESTSSTYTYVDDATIVNALATNGYIQVGYYKISMLETQKVDLTGYQTKIDSSHKLSADLVDDTSTTNKFVTSSDITTWNGKSVVSGTNDGTNWQTITIDGTTKSIPTPITVDSALSSSSTNPVKNSALYKAVVGKEVTVPIYLTEWSEPSGTNFYNTVAIATLPSGTFTNNCTLELLNYEGFNYFAKHGFVLYGYEVSSQRIWITAHDKPTTTIYLKMMVYNYE